MTGRVCITPPQRQVDKWLKIATTLEGNDPDAKAAALTTLDSQVDGAPFLVNQALTVADLGVLLAASGLPADTLQAYPHLHAWLDCVSSADLGRLQGRAAVRAFQPANGAVLLAPAVVKPVKAPTQPAAASTAETAAETAPQVVAEAPTMAQPSADEDAEARKERRKAEKLAAKEAKAARAAAKQAKMAAAPQDGGSTRRAKLKAEAEAKRVRSA